MNDAPVMARARPGTGWLPDRGLPLLVLGWRWAGCAVAAAVWAARPDAGHSLGRGLLYVGIAVLMSVLLTATARTRPPAVRGIDLLLVADLFVAAVLLLAGGVDAFAMYALAPVLAAGLRYGRATRLAAGRDAPILARVETEIRELSQRNRELKTFEEIASTMQTTMDVTEVQERVVVGVTEGLGYPRAVLGLCDVGETHVTGWLAAARGGQRVAVDHLLLLDLTEDHGVVRGALARADASLVRTADARSAGDRRLLAAFDGATHAVVAPVRCRGHLVGCLLVESLPHQTALDGETAHVLERLATQAGLALANVRLCVERTQKLTLEQERMRIAADMHDSIAQALFGIVFQLNALARQLPAQDPDLARRLGDLGNVAQKALEQVRTTIFDIWPADLTADTLTADLAGAVGALAPALDVHVRVAPDFDVVDTDVRKGVFRIAHEALANVAKHARARNAWVSVDVRPDAVLLEVRDDGVGMPDVRPVASDSLGVRGMVERAEALGGTLVMERCPDGGTRVTSHLPRLLCRVL